MQEGGRARAADSTSASVSVGTTIKPGRRDSFAHESSEQHCQVRYALDRNESGQRAARVRSGANVRRITLGAVRRSPLRIQSGAFKSFVRDQPNSVDLTARPSFSRELGRRRVVKAAFAATAGHGSLGVSTARHGRTCSLHSPARIKLPRRSSRGGLSAQWLARAYLVLTRPQTAALPKGILRVKLNFPPRQPRSPRTHGIARDNRRRRRYFVQVYFSSVIATYAARTSRVLPGIARSMTKVLLQTVIEIHPDTGRSWASRRAISDGENFGR